MSGLTAYLINSGVLSNGTKDDIERCKKDYWKQYRKEWRKKKRQECKIYTVFLSKYEYREIKKASVKKNSNITQFIKSSALQIAAICSVLDKQLVGKVREVFFETYQKIELSDNLESLEEFLVLEQKVLALIQSK